MSGLREKARSVKEAGVAERGNFTPTGVPKRMYQYWLSESNSKRARRVRAGTQKENFCHFWRVVFFWAPLRAIWNGLYTSAPVWGSVLLLSGLGVFIYFLITASSFLLFVLGCLAVVACLALGMTGMFAGVALGMTASQRRRQDFEFGNWVWPMALVGLPTAIPAFLVTKAINLYKEHLSDYNKQIGIGTAIAAVIGVVCLFGLANGWASVALAAGIVAAVLAGLAVLLVGGFFLADYISGLRATVRSRADERLEAYYEKHGHYPPAAPRREPGVIAKFFTGLGDFIVLAAQVVRVTKWKICPLIEVDSDDRIAA